MSLWFKSHQILTPHQRPRISLRRLNISQKCSNHQSSKELFLIRHQRSSLKRSVISTSLSSPRSTRKLCSSNNKFKVAKAQALLCPSLNSLNSRHHSCKAPHQQPQRCFRAPMSQWQLPLTTALCPCTKSTRLPWHPASLSSSQCAQSWNSRRPLHLLLTKKTR